MKKTILLDLDGTLLGTNEDMFSKNYTVSLSGHLAKLGFDPHAIAKALKDGTYAMFKNDGSKRNDLAFWDAFEQSSQIKPAQIESAIYEYYTNEFDKVKICCTAYEHSKKIVDLLKSKGYTLVLATNPYLPRIATCKRIEWAGLHPDDFSYITTFDNSHFTKNNSGYYKELLENLGLRGEDVIMVGNSTSDDGVITEFGAEFALVTNNLVDNATVAPPTIFKGTLSELYDFFDENY